MLARKFFGIFIFLLWGTLAFAADHIKSQAFLEDSTRSIAFESLAQGGFQPFTGILNLGYSPSTFWIRLHLNPEGASESLILRIRPNYLDEIALFDPEFGSFGQELRGDEQSAHDQYLSLNLNFTIPAGTSPRDIWLRIRTDTTLIFAAEVLDSDDAAKADAAQQLKSSFYLAIIGLFVAWGLLNGWGSKDQVIILFSLKEALCLVYMAGILGYFSYFWPSTWSMTPGGFVDLSMGPYGAVSFWFEYKFLKEYRPNRHLLTVLRWMPAFLPIYLILLAMGESQWAFRLCMSLFVLVPVLMFIIALTVRPISDPSDPKLSTPLSRRTLVLVYGVILLGLSSTTLPAMGLTPAGFMIFDGLLIYSLINGIAILIVLQLRIRIKESQRVALEIQNREIKKQYETERVGREEQSRFLAMLTHELRTPMSAIRMTLGATKCETDLYTEATQSIEEMTAILDRCLTTDQLDLGKMTSQQGEFWVGSEVTHMVSRSSDPSRISVQMGTDTLINSDVVLFRLAMANLIDNALKYGKKSEIVQVSIEQKDGLLSIMLRNLPGDAGWPDSEKLFQKYYRSPKAQKISGTGLGLYLAQQLIQNLGGSLRYTPSASYIGFTLCLPL